jgi:hypothetical protein
VEIPVSVQKFNTTDREMQAEVAQKCPLKLQFPHPNVLFFNTFELIEKVVHDNV